ncbi:hypothetical protein M9H77_08891 [Catharanthus roseus]|uniref:Uncharacterized protein n=1 Tax=Catharanthus roseus TaxID=4058 RepID=A0ACC0BZ39_CATRO|nr:hypothetical protein M9H77_08891 [Catharanthus roseus]
MSSFTDSFDHLGGNSPAGLTQPFEGGYNESQHFDSFSNFAESDDSAADSSPPPIYVSGGGFALIQRDFHQKLIEGRWMVTIVRQMDQFCHLHQRCKRRVTLSGNRGSEVTATINFATLMCLPHSFPF